MPTIIIVYYYAGGGIQDTTLPSQQCIIIIIAITLRHNDRFRTIPQQYISSTTESIYKHSLTIIIIIIMRKYTSCPERDYTYCQYK